MKAKVKSIESQTIKNANTSHVSLNNPSLSKRISSNFKAESEIIINSDSDSKNESRDVSHCQDSLR